MKLKEFFLQRKTNKILGVDIGVNTIKIAVLNKSQPDDFILETIPIDNRHPESLGAALRAKLNSLQIKKAKAVTAIPDTFVITKTISLAKSLSTFEIEQHLLLEAERYFGCPAQDICVDFEKSITDHPAQQEIYVVAAKRAEFEWREKVLQLAGLQVQAIDVAAFALMRAAQWFCQDSQVTVINLNTDQYQILVFDSNKSMIRQEKNIIANLSLSHLAQEIKQQLALLPALSQKILLVGEYPELNLLATELQQMVTLPVKSFHLPEFAVSFGLALWSAV